MDIERIKFGPEFMAMAGESVKEKSLELLQISVLITEMGPGFLFRGDHGVKETCDHIMGEGWYTGFVKKISDAMDENERIHEVLIECVDELDKGIKRLGKRGKEGEEG